MKMKWLVLTVGLALVASFVQAREIVERSKARVPLAGTAVDPDATGIADFSSKGGKSRFRLKVKNAPPSQPVELIVGGVSRGLYTTSAKGVVSIDLLGGSTLDFDPRGREIVIEDDSDQRLLTGGGTNGAAGSHDERVNLVPTGLQPLASGHATYRTKNGAGRFNVEFEDVTDGTYDILVDSNVVHTVATVGGIAEVEFGDDDGGPALTFDPIGKLIQVALNGDIVLANTFLASAPGVSDCTPSENTTLLVPTANAPGGSGDARLRTLDDCRRDFRVEIEDVPVGAYDLFVAGVNRGTINVAVQLDASIQGEIEFSSELDDSLSDELPLTFDPAGAAIEIRQGTNVFFTAIAGTNTIGTCTVVDSEVDFISTDLDADAKGKSRYRQDENCGRNMRVEVERLPASVYDLKVGGILRGTITVTGEGSTSFGEIEFDTEPSPGKVLLTFDPRGQLVEVLQDGNLYLSVTMPN